MDVDYYREVNLFGVDFKINKRTKECIKMFCTYDRRISCLVSHKIFGIAEKM